MKKIRHFICGSCQRRYEKLVGDEVLSVDCECGSKAARTLSSPRYFGNTTGKSPALKK